MLDSGKALGSPFVVQAGDMGYSCECGRDGTAQAILAVPGAPVGIPGMGNHEGDGVGKKSWFDVITPGIIPDNAWATAPAGKDGNNDAVYFSYTYGKKYHFIALDADIGKSYGGDYTGGTIDSIQMEWFKAEMAANRDKHIFVFAHEPISQVYLHGDYGLGNYSSGAIVTLMAEHIALTGKQAWVFSGHLGSSFQMTTYGGVQQAHVQGPIVRMTIDGDDITMNTSIKYDLTQTDAYGVQYDSANDLNVLHIAKDSVGGIYWHDLSSAGKFSVVGPENGITPPTGNKMIKSSAITWYFSWLLSAQTFPIQPGMKISYHIYLDKTADGKDKIQLVPGIMDHNIFKTHTGAMVDGYVNGVANNTGTVVDQNGIALPLGDVPGSCCNGNLKNLGGRATNKWYYREFDVGHLAGTHSVWGFRINSKALEGEAQAVYLDDIKVTWPAAGGTTITGKQEGIYENVKSSLIEANPNPFNPLTVLKFPNPKKEALLSIYNAKGETIIGHKAIGIEEKFLTL